MKKLSLQYSFIEATKYLFIVLWGYTGSSKFLEHAQFERTLRQVLQPVEWATFMSYAVPAIELGIAVLLILPRWKGIGLLASTALMVFFTIYVGLVLVMMKERPCSCGGIFAQWTWKQHAWINTTITILGALATWLHYQCNAFIAINNRGSRKPVEQSR